MALAHACHPPPESPPCIPPESGTIIAGKQGLNAAMQAPFGCRHRGNA